jgi:hypothetical protein
MKPLVLAAFLAFAQPLPRHEVDTLSLEPLWQPEWWRGFLQGLEP